MSGKLTSEQLATMSLVSSLSEDWHVRQYFKFVGLKPIDGGVPYTLNERMKYREARRTRLQKKYQTKKVEGLG